MAKTPAPTAALTLACITAVSIVGYTLISARKKDLTSGGNSKDDTQEKATNDTTATTSNTNPAADTETITDTPPKSKSIPGQIDISQPSAISALRRLQASNTITIAYASTTGTCKGFATALHDALKILLKSQGTQVQMCTTEELDWWDELLNNEEEEDEASSPSTHENLTAPVVIFILRKLSCYRACSMQYSAIILYENTVL
jgi:pectate lyase